MYNPAPNDSDTGDVPWLALQDTDGLRTSSGLREVNGIGILRGLRPEEMCLMLRKPEPSPSAHLFVFLDTHKISTAPFLIAVTVPLQIFFLMGPSCSHTALLLKVRHWVLAFSFWTLLRALAVPSCDGLRARVWLPPGKQQRGLSEASPAPALLHFSPPPCPVNSCLFLDT